MFAHPKNEAVWLCSREIFLLEPPLAKELLASNIPARLAYVATDGTPRVLPIWFHWDGRQL